MSAELEPARLDDVDELLRLYRRVYGRGYALPLGTDPAVMAREISAEQTTWLVAREPGGGPIVASIVATVAESDRMAKMQGLVVHPDSRGSGLAQDAVRTLSDHLLADERVDSVYSTARTTSLAPQRICLRSGFRALGVFPNLRKAARHETMVLLARHADGVLQRRYPVLRLPESLGPLIDAVDAAVGLPLRPELVADPKPQEPPEAAPPSGEVELISAPQFVLRRFDEVVTDPVRRFYPFHTPNVMLIGPDGVYEVYAHLSRSDGYCTLIGAAPDPLAVARHMDQIIAQLNDFGAYYVEVLVPMNSFEELSALVAYGFLPVAVYPAMRADGGRFHDYVVLARTMQPLDFRGIALDAAFRAFTEQYIDLWTRKYLNTREVFR